MAGRGPPKKPTALKLVAGNPGKKPLPKHEPKPRALESLAAPARLKDKAARAAWKRVAPELARMRVLSEADVEALVLYCETFATWDQARAEVRAQGVTIDTAQGLKKHPALTAMNEATTQMRTLLAQFGMTPASRASVEKIDERAPGSAWDDFEAAG